MSIRFFFHLITINLFVVLVGNKIRAMENPKRSGMEINDDTGAKKRNDEVLDKHNPEPSQAFKYMRCLAENGLVGVTTDCDIEDVVLSSPRPAEPKVVVSACEKIL